MISSTALLQCPDPHKRIQASEVAVGMKLPSPDRRKATVRGVARVSATGVQVRVWDTSLGVWHELIVGDRTPIYTLTGWMLAQDMLSVSSQIMLYHRQMFTLYHEVDAQAVLVPSHSFVSLTLDGGGAQVIANSFVVRETPYG